MFTSKRLIYILKNMGAGTTIPNLKKHNWS